MTLDNQDIVALKEWMAKEPHLPDDFEDEIIDKFLHSCYGSLERTKKCIDRFFSGRSQMPEVFTSRDPTSPNMQKAFSALQVALLETDKDEIWINFYDDPTLEKFVFYDLLKAVTLLSDYWVKFYRFKPEGNIVIMDLKYYSLKMVPKVNIMFFRDFLLFLLGAMPIRMKKVLVVNAPSFYDKLFALVKPALPAEICEMIHFYPDHQGLYEFVDKKYLPSEYGGGAGSMKEHTQLWWERITKEKELLTNDNLWKADLKKKPKTDGADNTMSGSFRTMAID